MTNYTPPAGTDLTRTLDLAAKAHHDEGNSSTGKLLADAADALRKMRAALSDVMQLWDNDAIVSLNPGTIDVGPLIRAREILTETTS